MIKKILAIFLAIAAISCSSDSNEPEVNIPDIPPINPNPGENESKPKGMWITGYDVNFRNMNNADNVMAYMKRCKLAGINLIYLDCMSQTGYMHGKVPNYKDANEAGWDWFDSIVDACDSLDMDLVIGVVPLLVGDPVNKRGVAFDSNRWNGKTQYKKVRKVDANNNYTGYEVVDSKDDPTTVAVVLNPTLEEVREYAAQVCVDVANAYKKHKSFKGISLDYVRWANNDSEGNWYGQGPATIANFERDMEVEINDLNDFITSTGGQGPLFREWTYYRTESVTKTIKLIYERVKAAVPECEVHLWASAQWSSRIAVGQNWATTSYIPNGWQYLPGYEKTGFADYLDVFILGAYANYAYSKDNPDPMSEWSVENFVKSYVQYIPKGHKCKVYGSLGSYLYNNNATKIQTMSDATMLCLSYTDGVMIFELGHVTNNNLWSGIKQGIDASGY